MNFKQLGVLVSVSTLLGMNVAATKALAQEEPSIKFEDAAASPGCIIADQLVGDDGRTLSLLFEDFAAANGKRKACSIRVETVIPSGFRVQEVQVLYQGSAEVPKGTTPPTLSRRYTFFGGALGTSKTPAQIATFKSSNPLYAVQDDLALISASCGGKGTLGVNAVAQSRKGNSLIVDTADFNAGRVLFSFDLGPC